ncbi:hypothetical protein [Alicyclobacillus macrosporangiidus]|uniref:Uncharacterized protein n=1 Tax=Alicyclobacillus macrosporangiidus TaxID=392015 RepID=A0A1I7KD65_9BACL|nr:hypothetical protein [Alicyclobacillus macrosporangiidus]SFU95373.1 hypothetical protein SAMN05421543_11546 [Alicyclobacillus macrosporangiidus]
MKTNLTRTQPPQGQGFCPGDKETSLPFSILAWDTDGLHCYSAPTHKEAREAAKRLSINEKFAIVLKMNNGIPQTIENVYRNGESEL